MANSTENPSCKDCGAFLFNSEALAVICDDCEAVRVRKIAGTYFEPGAIEQREIAVERELVELQKIVKAFDRVVADAQNLADECKLSAERCKKMFSDEDLDKQIDDLDYLMKRGAYRHLRNVDSIMGKFDELVDDFKGLKI